MGKRNPNQDKNINPKGIKTTPETHIGHWLTVEDKRKGGRASAIKREERKTLKEDLLLLLSTGDAQQKINLALIQKAMDGDTRAYEILRDTIGEKPTDKAEIDTQIEIVTDGSTADWAK